MGVISSASGKPKVNIDLCDLQPITKDMKTAVSAPKSEIKSEPAKSSELPLQQPVQQMAGEIGGPKGLEPTRFGDWCDDNGRCTDF